MNQQSIPAPQVLLAEVTHRCPLQCPYCSNPTELIKKDVEISTSDWARVFKEAADLGVLQVSISGGEPAARRDLTKLIQSARDSDLYVNLITSGIGLTKDRLNELVDAGCDHIQLSLQDVDSSGAKLISNMDKSLERKLEFASWVTDLSVPLTINAVMHKLNLDRLPETIELALNLGARRLEIANVQYHGWAALNKDLLMPTLEQSAKTNQTVAEARESLKGRLLIDYVPVDHYAEYPKSCMNGWGRVALIVAPDGAVLPCHNATTLTHLSFPNVNSQSLQTIWYESPAFNAYRAVGYDGLFTQPNADSLSRYAGVTRMATVIGDPIDVVRQGLMTEAGWNWTPNQPVFISANGVITQTVPVGTPIRRIGWAISATELNLDPYPIIGV